MIRIVPDVDNARYRKYDDPAVIETLFAIPGKIEVRNGQCVADGRVVDCPDTTWFGLGGETQAGTQLNLLPPTGSFATLADTQNDPLFIGALVVVISLLVWLTVGQIKLVRRTITEYVQPIWLLVVISLLVVAWQYLVGVETGSSPLALRISQWVWELAVAASAVILVRRYRDFRLGNLVVLGILYSLIIHGTKITVRYLFYDKTLLYVLDRFLYGSLLVLAITVAIGAAALYVARSQSGRGLSSPSSV